VATSGFDKGGAVEHPESLPRKIGETSLGKVEYIENGQGAPVLFVHGSPGGCDQGAVMGDFLAWQGFRVIALSSPGYLGTPLTDDLETPDQQADLELALMDSLDVDRFGVMCWSGGGPSSYRMSVKHPDRVAALVVLAGASMKYEFANGINSLEYSLLTGGLGTWLFKEMAEHMPKAVVKMSVSDESDLSKEKAKALSEYIWNDEEKRQFVLAISGTISGRKDGLENDRDQFAKIGDLELDKITLPTVLVHGTADSDVHPDQTENAAAHIPSAEVIRVQDGTHLCAWTDPTSADIQQRIAAVIRDALGARSRS
jgi:pimeloyl-ACP methyl ester carboxylesterase